MTSEDQGRGAADSPELIDTSAPEEITSNSEEEPMEQEINDRRLAQAIRYLHEEGGDDSPTTFIGRVDRIDGFLLQQLPQQGRNFDLNLYRRARAMVREVQIDFEEAAQDSSSSIRSRETPALDSVEELPECYTPSTADVLYRKGDVPDEPRSKPHRHIPAAAAEENVRRSHIFKYGGPNNEAESWYKNNPASLPFPETFQLAHWESLKIDFDLNESVKKMKSEGKIVETNLPFDHPALEPYKSLPGHESGSRFKLPKTSATVQKEINRLGTPKTLAKVVQDLNRSNEKVKDGNYEYTPRVFLEKLTVGDQVHPTTIRHAVNTTPTKSRIGNTGSKVQHNPSKATRKGPVVKTATKPISINSPPAISQASEIDAAVADEQARLTEEEAHTEKHISRAAEWAVRVAQENLLKAKEDHSSTKHTNPVPLTSRAQFASPVVRKINRERAASLERSPRRQSGKSTAPPSPETPIKQTTVHPKVVIKKRPRCRPPKSSPAVPPKSQSISKPDDVATSKQPTKKPSKRKHHTSDQNYTPDSKRPKPTTSSALRNPVRTRAQTTPDKVVHFLPEEPDEPDNLVENDVSKGLLKSPTSVVLVKTKAIRKVERTKVVPESMTKAAAAGEAVRKARRMAEKQKAKSELKAGNTRSGARYLKE